jgi:opacity protein-like surface antigen
VSSQAGLLQKTAEKVTAGSVILSGFFTLEFRDLQSEDSTFRYLPGVSPQSTFNNSHINLYLDAKFIQDFRFFAELRFVYQPYTIFVESLAKFNTAGQVLIERAWVDWLFRDWLSFRAGNFLVPYGIWNLEHGDPILLSTFTPVLLRREIFPERATGLQVYGRVDFEDFELLYYAWVGNGKGSQIGTEDDQNNKALGGRLELKLPDYGKLTKMAVGVSGYLGKVKPSEITDRKLLDGIQRVYTSEGNLAALNELTMGGYDPGGDPLGEFRDNVIGFDFRFRLYGFFFQGEFAINGVRPTETVTVSVDTNGDGVPDTNQDVEPRFSRQYGAYMQYAYEFDLDDWGLLTPFLRFDWLEGNDRYRRDLSTFTILIGGVNWKVNDNVVLKAEYHTTRFRDAHSRDFDGFYSSLCVSF